MNLGLVIIKYTFFVCTYRAKLRVKEAKLKTALSLTSFYKYCGH